MSISTQEKMLIEQRVANDAKSVMVAYVLWFFAGLAGAHRFYLGRSFSGFILLLISLFGVILMFAGIGAILLAFSVIWLLWDMIAIPGIAESHKRRLRERLTREYATG